MEISTVIERSGSKTYCYHAIDDGGKEVSGEIIVDYAHDIKQKLSENGLKLVSAFRKKILNDKLDSGFFPGEIG